jgi:hypothetical protein
MGSFVSELLRKRKKRGYFDLFSGLKTGWGSCWLLSVTRSYGAFAVLENGFTILKRAFIWFSGWIMPLYVCIMK